MWESYAQHDDSRALLYSSNQAKQFKIQIHRGTAEKKMATEVIISNINGVPPVVIAVFVTMSIVVLLSWTSEAFLCYSRQPKNPSLYFGEGGNESYASVVSEIANIASKVCPGLRALHSSTAAEELSWYC